MDQKNEYNFEIKKENGQWKIAREDVTSDFVDLPKDIDIKAAEILQKYNQEQAAVLSDLKTYYKAYNTEDLNLTLQYTAPSFIERWNTGATDWYRWEEMLKGHFEYSDSRYKLSEVRVIFLGKKEAVVQGVLEWTDSTQGIAEGDDVFPALIYMEFANGHWNYSDHLSLDPDF
ncbi:hypothetical protein ACE3NQ_09210 [Paenibacillus terreus]|uniref:SnoaL-like domain-containing protein n=1 Tax=Paenibacillus terreus TaxID=1387834 RepID=A0ABV5B6H8_9BACL